MYELLLIHLLNVLCVCLAMVINKSWLVLVYLRVKMEQILLVLTLHRLFQPFAKRI